MLSEVFRHVVVIFDFAFLSENINDIYCAFAVQSRY